jgi:hypothetical protein
MRARPRIEELVEDLLQDVAIESAEDFEAALSADAPPTAPRVRGKGWKELKRFGKNKDRAYWYFRWREGRVKRSQYIGKA